MPSPCHLHAACNANQLCCHVEPQESFQKALRSLETGLHGWGCNSRTVHMPSAAEWEAIRHSLRVPNPERMVDIHKGMAAGMTQAEVCELTNMDPWFLDQMGDLLASEQWLQSVSLADVTPRDFTKLKRKARSLLLPFFNLSVPALVQILTSTAC